MHVPALQRISEGYAYVYGYWNTTGLTKVLKSALHIFKFQAIVAPELAEGEVCPCNNSLF